MRKNGDRDGKLGSPLLLQKLPHVPAERVLLVGLGAERDFNESAYRTAVSAAGRALKSTGAADATLCLTSLPLKKRDTAWKVEQAVILLADAFYRFDRLKSKASDSRRTLKKIALVVDKADAKSAEAARAQGKAIADGMSFAKDLGNLPGNVCTPTYLGEQAIEMGKQSGIKVTVLEKKQIEALGMGSFLAVAQGSKQPPRFIIIEYMAGKKGDAPVALVGKGVTFDTGGISLKPAAEMDEMKFDMCGAASVLGTMKTIAAMKLPINVVGVVPATENMPGGNAI